MLQEKKVLWAAILALGFADVGLSEKPNVKYWELDEDRFCETVEGVNDESTAHMATSFQKIDFEHPVTKLKVVNTFGDILFKNDSSRKPYVSVTKKGFGYSQEEAIEKRDRLFYHYGFEEGVFNFTVEEDAAYDFSGVDLVFYNMGDRTIDIEGIYSHIYSNSVKNISVSSLMGAVDLKKIRGQAEIGLKTGSLFAGFQNNSGVHNANIQMEFGQAHIGIYLARNTNTHVHLQMKPWLSQINFMGSFQGFNPLPINKHDTIGAGVGTIHANIKTGQLVYDSNYTANKYKPLKRNPNSSIIAARLYCSSRK